jgi:hypothetical protein
MVRVVTLPRRDVAVIIVLILVLTIALIVNVGPDGGKAPLGNKAERAPGGLSGWSDLGLGALVGALAGAVGTHALRERAETKREARELQGLLRMLYVEIEVNRGETELLLNAPNPKAGPWTDTIYKDGTWKEVRSRLAQLMPDADHFNQLTAYYARNDAHERGIFKVIGMGSSFSNPGDPMAKLMADLLREQMGLAIAALEMIKGYIGDPPVGRESVEDAVREMRRLQRELDAERERREREEER